MGDVHEIQGADEDVTETHTIEINGVAFDGLNKLQYSVLKDLADEKELKAQEVLTGPQNG